MKVEPFDWFPKPFGPGDLDGQGARRLLGQPSLDPTTLLVRETAQNSWDARLPDRPVRFSMHVRRLEHHEHRLLRERILTGDPPRTGLRPALEAPELTVVEIADRGTRGLGGPIRNDVAVPESSARDFINLVFNVGVPRNVPLGAGTYGFGRTVAYLASKPGTVVIHSQATGGQGESRSRLIGAAAGEAFAMGGWQYTGWHWWGRKADGGRRIEPATGGEADALARELLYDPPAEDDSGTTLLVVDPDLAGDGREAYARRLANAMLWHLWPKLVPPEPGQPLMTLEVMADGQDVAIPDPSEHPVLKGHVEALRAVRAVQTGREPDSRFPTVVRPLTRYNEVVGHLALTTYDSMGVPAAADEPDEPVVGITGKSRHVALMRHQAELVVNYRGERPLASPSLQWAGVFKPVEESDHAFARAEPPAHDAWEPNSVAEKRDASRVRVALKRIDDAANEHVSTGSGQESGRNVVSGARLGDALAGLVTEAEGTAPSHGQSRSSGNPPGTSAPQLWGLAEPLRLQDGWVRHLVAVELPDTPESGTAEAVITVGYEGGREHDPHAIRDIKFLRSGTRERASQGRRLELADGDPRSWQLEFEAAPGIAVDVAVRYQGQD